MVYLIAGGRSIRRGLGLAISSIGVLAAQPVRADCVESGSTTTCSSAGTNPWTTTIGTGRGDDGKTVIVQDGATVDTKDVTAISLGDGASVTVSGTVRTTADTGMGNYGSGINTIEANSNSTIVVTSTGKVVANGSNPFDEGVNVHGYGNKIINYGVIEGGPGGAVWFQDEQTGTKNILDNYGTLQRSSGKGYIIGTNAAAGIVFYNRAGAKVLGDLNFGDGDDDLYFEPNSLVTGVVDGGGGVNNLYLQGEAGSAGTLAGYVTNFPNLTKQGDGRWTVTGSLEGFTTVDVRQGTLALSGNNEDFSVVVVVDPDGTLEGRAQNLPAKTNAADNTNNIQNNGLVRFAQPDDGTYVGQIVGSGAVEKTGGGTLTLAPAAGLGNSYSGGTTIKEGMIAIAADNALGASSGGITFDGGGLRTTVDLTTSRAATLAAGGGTLAPVAGTTLVYEGVMTGPGALTKADTGRLVTTAANTYSGITRVEAGELQAGAPGTFSPASVYAISPGALVALMDNDQNVGGVVNAGEVQWGNGALGTRLVAGSYEGQGGLLAMKSRLDGDNSPTDLLHVTGDTAGSTYVRVTNVGGTGAETNQGIRLIDVDGASNGSFTLLGDYNAKTGRPAIVAGAYAYSLVQGSPAAPGDGDWYLRSTSLTADADTTETGTSTGSGGNGDSSSGKPLYQPGVPLYEVYGQALLTLNKMPTLQQRVGNRYWVTSTPAAEDDGDGQSDGTAATPLVEGQGAWARVEAGHSRIDPRSSTSDSEYTQDLWRFQGGLDTRLWEGTAGQLIGGVNVHYGTLTADIRSFNGDGKIDVKGYGFGGTLTWYGQDGVYVDGQGQLTRYDSDLHSDTLGRNMASGNDGFGYGLSLETGKRIRLNDSWTLTPQVQLPFSSVDFDSFSDSFGAKVERRQASSLNSRLGLAADYESAWKQPDGRTGKVHLYGISNLYYEMLDGVKVDVSGTNLANDNERLWGGVGLGGSVSWADGRYALYAEAGVDTSLANPGDSYGLNGTLGLRYKW
ncbi:outer membrane autotransporter barrel domain-containing protein [Arboricoccus pini]|uniref:Outer membrane autotransporter barrel domain-containing protein n=1 Tax=Arboricoccus pini TaxID=1963835 RepID=A0A212RY63_9PROT|nr:autotransporter outer membrane beta-barrel domain-containing protein [Arboricoccus pini]SNB77647.1 outer membrane autotransporter barrel domain-containing protein [Arboricoccus pini]